MATLLKKFGAQWMRNEEHFGFMTFVSGVADKLTGEAIAKVLAAFRAALQEEDLSLEQQRKSELTASVVQLDVERDRAWRALQLLSMSASLSVDAAVAASADRVMGLFDRYGDPRDLPYTQANGVYKNLLQDLASEAYSADIKAMAADIHVRTMKEKCEAFMTVFTNRNAEQAALGASRVKEARRVLDTAWRNLWQMVNVTVSVDGEGDGIGLFVGEVNRQIDYQRTVKLNRANLNAKKRGEKEQTGQE